jgi:hypothetical protein
MRTTGPSQAGSGGLEESSLKLVTDERIRVLGTYITREEQNQGRLRLAKSLSVLRKRLYLVELIGNYLDEHEAWEAWKDEPKSKRRKTKGPRPSLNRYTDILFPQTKGWKDVQPGETEASKAARAVLRKQAKNALEYRISLGKALVMLTRQNGIGILGVVPEKTEN